MAEKPFELIEFVGGKFDGQRIMAAPDKSAYLFPFIGDNMIPSPLPPDVMPVFVGIYLRRGDTKLFDLAIICLN